MQDIKLQFTQPVIRCLFDAILNDPFDLYEGFVDNACPRIIEVSAIHEVVVFEPAGGTDVWKPCTHHYGCTQPNIVL